ncbi:ABC transporter permease [Nakamurella sp. YIM 132087]|uniref:Autoinducer 2 import system permease protein LsrD n=1 Tax=Nakamurella alba TaxID=2665158 RepID=A0A7K1FQ91_9ACTN|nr:ABC transporter permease [Nakamurella alba]MTD16301.1 ABC transporter permease [Nakamurella alba]
MIARAKRMLLRWEVLLVVLVVAAMAWSASLSPYYLYLDQILGSTRFFVIPGLMALGLMIVVIQGEIDISLASTLAVATTTAAVLMHAGWPAPATLAAVVVIGGALGAVNGLLVARWGLPSLAVTLGTMGAYRGLAYIIGGQEGVSDFPDSFTWLGGTDLGIVPASLVLFVVVAVAVALLLRTTVFGRHSYAVGAGARAAAFGGVPLQRTKITAYLLAGALAGLAGWVWIGQYASARADNADGGILFVVTAVVLGGVAINGGRGTVLGVVLALFLLGTLSNGLGLANVAGPTQTLILGGLLVLSTAVPRVVVLVGRALPSRRTRSDAVDRPRSDTRPDADTVGTPVTRSS